VYLVKSLLTLARLMQNLDVYQWDWKPENVYIDVKGNAYVIDFGMAIEAD
jgi:hypothetical protein